MAAEKDTLSKFDEARETFIQGAGKVSSALLGMVNKVGGQIYALLFLNDEPLSLDDIAERLRVSKSNVSINIRMLEDIRLVRKVWVKGSRRDFYAAERVYPKKVLKDFLEKIQRTMHDAVNTIERTRSRVHEARMDAKGDEKEEAEFMLEQLDLIASFYYAAIQFFDDFFNGKPVNVDLLRYVILNPEDIQNATDK